MAVEHDGKRGYQRGAETQNSFKAVLESSGPGVDKVEPCLNGKFRLVITRVLGSDPHSARHGDMAQRLM